MRLQFLGRYALPEMVVLGVAEMILTFALTLVLLTPASGSVSVSSLHPALICALTVGFIAFVTGLYRPQMFLRARHLIFNTVLSALLSFPAVWLVSKVFGLSSYWPVGYDPFRPLKIVAIWSGGLVCIRMIFLFATRFDFFLHRAAIVGPGAAEAAAYASTARTRFLEITPIRAEQASAARLKSERFQTLILSNGSDKLMPEAISAEYSRTGISLQTQADFWERHLRRIDITSLDSSWFSALDNMQLSHLQAVLTRALDVATSLALILATLPLMATIMFLVKIDSSGPVFYRQERAGLGGKPFTLFKFRSMRNNAETTGPTWAQQKDPRVTRIGSFMRKTRIDELPQLLNILRGEMSFIGPRPERPHFVDQLQKVIPCYHERSRVKPGLTGWAQVNFPYGASIEDARAKLSYDLYYVKNRSVGLDVLILLSTIRVILFQEGAR